MVKTPDDQPKAGIARRQEIDNLCDIIDEVITSTEDNRDVVVYYNEIWQYDYIDVKDEIVRRYKDVGWKWVYWVAGEEKHYTDRLILSDNSFHEPVVVKQTNIFRQLWNLLSGAGA